ncbi:MAG TPA: LCP family protein [Micromonosporaceae bacterium]|nr:LCP family protein [Micromonosporaceae bacterium]
MSSQETDENTGTPVGDLGGDTGEPDRDAAASPPRRGRRWWRLLALISALVLVLVVGGVAVGGWFYARSVDKTIDRVDVFSTVPEAGRPAKTASSARNVLVLGSDSRDPDPTGSRADTIILVHLPANRERAQLISIPRDTWTTVPTDAGGAKAKINAAYAWGGTSLMVRTVERFTGVRIDHVVMVDFAGFKEIVDAVGGIDVEVYEAFTSIHPPFRKFPVGIQHMDGTAALDFARQRYQFRDGDFTRMKNQQQVIGALIDRATQRGLVTSPGRLDDFLRATANSVTVDNTLSIFDLAWELRGIRSADIDRLTSPSAGTGMVGGQSVVFPDERAATELYAAVRSDDIADWLKAHPRG